MFLKRSSSTCLPCPFRPYVNSKVYLLLKYDCSHKLCSPSNAFKRYFTTVQIFYDAINSIKRTQNVNTRIDIKIRRHIAGAKAQNGKTWESLKPIWWRRNEDSRGTSNSFGFPLVHKRGNSLEFAENDRSETDRSCSESTFLLTHTAPKSPNPTSLSGPRLQAIRVGIPQVRPLRNETLIQHQSRVGRIRRIDTDPLNDGHPREVIPAWAGNTYTHTASARVGRAQCVGIQVTDCAKAWTDSLFGSGRKRKPGRGKAIRRRISGQRSNLEEFFHRPSPFLPVHLSDSRRTSNARFEKASKFLLRCTKNKRYCTRSFYLRFRL